jgi:hypothetical protein
MTSGGINYVGKDVRKTSFDGRLIRNPHEAANAARKTNPLLQPFLAQAPVPVPDRSTPVLENAHRRSLTAVGANASSCQQED